MLLLLKISSTHAAASPVRVRLTATTVLGNDVSGWLQVAWSQAQRGSFAHLVDGYHRHRRWAEPGGSAVSHDASVYPANGDGSASPVDGPKRLHGCGIADRRNDWNQTQSVGILPEKSGQEPAPKKLPETDAIFAQVKQRNEEAQADEQTLRISLDAKAAVKVGPFARGAKTRVRTSAADHDF